MDERKKTIKKEKELYEMKEGNLTKRNLWKTTVWEHKIEKKKKYCV